MGGGGDGYIQCSAPGGSLGLLGQAGRGAAGRAVAFLEAFHSAGHLQARGDVEAATPNLGGTGAALGIGTPQTPPTIPQPPPPPALLTMKAGSTGCAKRALKVCSSCLVRAL